MPPPQTRTRSTPASAACRSRSPVALAGDPGREARRPGSSSRRGRRAGSPLTTRVKPVPCASARGVQLDGAEADAALPARPARRAPRRRQRQLARRTAAVRRSRAATTGPASGHLERVRRPVVPGDRGARAASPADPWPRSAQPAPRPAVRSTSTRELDHGRCRPSTVTSGRTRASRAVDQRSSRTGRQIPAVTSVGPPVPAEGAGHLADVLDTARDRRRAASPSRAADRLGLGVGGGERARSAAPGSSRR